MAAFRTYGCLSCMVAVAGNEDNLTYHISIMRYERGPERVGEAVEELAQKRLDTAGSV